MLELLLRVALTPQGTAKLLASCEVLRHSEADERRLARLCGLLACGAALEFEARHASPAYHPIWPSSSGWALPSYHPLHVQVGVLKLLCLMVDGPAEAETRAQVRGGERRGERRERVERGRVERVWRGEGEERRGCGEERVQKRGTNLPSSRTPHPAPRRSPRLFPR